MYGFVLPALAATAVTWLMTALGAGMVVFFPNPSGRQLRFWTGFSAGVMLAASYWSLLEPGLELAGKAGHIPWAVAAGGFLAGAVFLWLTDRVSRRLLAGRGRGAPPGWLLVLSITAHNIPEGLAVGVAFGALSSGDRQAFWGAVAVAVGIAIQNFPEGAAVSLPLLRSGCGRKKSFLIGQATALVEPVAGVVGALLVHEVRLLLPYALCFAAGAMILVAVHELIPQGRVADAPWVATWGITLGFAVMMVLDVMLG